MVITAALTLRERLRIDYRSKAYEPLLSMLLTLITRWIWLGMSRFPPVIHLSILGSWILAGFEDPKSQVVFHFCKRPSHGYP